MEAAYRRRELWLSSSRLEQAETTFTAFSLRAGSSRGGVGQEREDRHTQRLRHEQPCSTLAPQVASTRVAGDDLQAYAAAGAQALPWTMLATRDALSAGRVGDAAAGMTTALDAYVKTLSRLLVLASSSAPDPQES